MITWCLNGNGLFLPPKLSWKHFVTKLFPQKGLFSFSKTKQMKSCIRCFEFFLNSNNNFSLQSIFILNDFIKNMSKKKLQTSEPFGSALWPNLLH